MNKFNVYPRPDYCSASEEKFYLNGKVKLVGGSFDSAEKALYCELWSRFTFSLSELIIEDGAENELVIGAPEKIVCAEHAYSVHIDEKGVYLKGKNKTELIHAFTTLLQLVYSEGTLKAEKAYVFHGDYGATAKVDVRAIHFCLFPNVGLDFLKQFIRAMGMYRYSHFVLEFWGTYRYECFPALGWEENSYSKEQILPLIKEANALGMEVIPFFNHLGHSAQSKVGSGEHVVLSQHPEYAPLFESDGWTWCVNNPETIKILKNVRDELIELCGSGAYFHIGLDEAFSFCTCPRCRDKDKNTVLADFINATAADLKKQGRKCVMWGDQLLPAEQFKPPYEANLVPDLETSKAIKNVSKDVIIADWQYRIYEGEVETSKFFRENGFNVWQSPWHNPNNVKTHINTAIQYGNGVLLTTWNVTQPFISQLLHAAEMLWMGEEQSSHAEYMSITGNILRKLAPPVKKAGQGWLGMWELY